MWKESGKPLNCQLHSVMKRTKAQYHYSIRRCKNAVHEIRNDKLVEALTSGDTDLFKEVKKYRESKKEVATVVDENIGPQNIANHFGNQYKNLYNQQESRNDMENLLDDLNQGVGNDEIVYAEAITPKLVNEI